MSESAGPRTPLSASTAPHDGASRERGTGPHFLAEQAAAGTGADDPFALADVSRILADLRVHLAELDRREQSLNSQLTLLDQEQRSLRMQQQRFEEETGEREAACTEREERLAERESSCSAVVEELDALQAGLREESERLERTRAALQGDIEREAAEERSKIAELREQVDSDFAHLREEQQEWESRKERELSDLEAELAEVRKEQTDELDGREADLNRREVDLEKRARFHEGHLERLRTGLEARQGEVDQNSGRQRIWIEQVEASIRGRLSHLRRFRELIDQREAACRDGWDQLEESRCSQQSALLEERRQLEEDRQAVEAQRRSQRSDVARQQDLFRLREQEVIRRTARLDAMRDDIERTHRETIGRQAMLDDRSGSQAQDGGAEEVPTTAPSHVVHEMLAALDQRRCELERDAEQHLRDRAEFQREQEALLETLSRREERLRVREGALTRHVEEIFARERAWHDAQVRAQAERAESEAVVRKVLAGIEEAVGASRRSGAG